MELLKNPIIVTLLTAAAVILLFLPARRIWKSRLKERQMVLSLYVLALIWLSRFSVYLFGTFSADSDMNNLNAFEAVFDSLIHALQTFSMDEDYTAFISAGKQTLTDQGYTMLAAVYGGLISLLNVLAPILGGALLLTILTKLFPELLILCYPRRHKYVFSDLNEQAVTLAEDICRNKNYAVLNALSENAHQPLIVFTDAYGDDGSELHNELLDRAQNLRALCIKKDLRHLSLRLSRSVTYLLIDEEPQHNLHAFSELTDPAAEKQLWPLPETAEESLTRIIVFVQKEHESDLVKNLIQDRGLSSLLTVRIIRDYMNAAVNLMYDAPLYLPLLERADHSDVPQQLRIVIFGSGRIAEETLRTVYWCSQMLNTEVFVDVISENAGELETSLRTGCPEMLESCKAGSDILAAYPESADKRPNPPYLARLRFTDHADVQNLASLDPELLRQTDYCIIALGSDQANLELTNSLRIAAAKRRLTTQSGGLVIVPAVFDSQLADAVRRQTPDSDGIRILPFASLRSRFSVKNVFMQNFMEDAIATAGLYGPDEQRKMLEDEYTYWANLARSVHASYKLYCTGILETVDLTQDAPEKRYRLRSCPALKTLRQTPEKQQYTKPILRQLAWLEHRRWNAFLRAQGFSCADDAMHESIFRLDKKKQHKNIRLKLHPCLVECTDEIHELPTQSPFDRSVLDGLDLVSVKRCELDSPEKRDAALMRKRDYKNWDYPSHDDSLNQLISRCMPDAKAAADSGQEKPAVPKLECPRCGRTMETGYLQGRGRIFWSQIQKDIFTKPDRADYAVAEAGRFPSRSAHTAFFCRRCHAVLIMEQKQEMHRKRAVRPEPQKPKRRPSPERGDGAPQRRKKPSA